MKNLKRKNHQLYLSSNFISILGDVAGMISMSWWVISVTESTTTMASILAPSVIARILGGPLFGTVADFISRKKIMIFCDILSSVFWLGILFYYLSGSFNPLFLSIYFFIINLNHSLLKAAAGGALADIGSVEDLMRKIQASSSVARIMGAAGGALFLQYFGTAVAMGFNIVSFALAAFLTSMIKIQEHLESNKTLNASEFTEGFKYMKKFPFLIFITTSLVFLQFFVAGFPVLIPSFVKLVKDMPPWYLGALEMSLGIGILLGSMIIIPLVKRYFFNRSLEVATLMMSIGALLMSVKDSIIAPIFGILFIQAGFVSGVVPLNSYMITSLPANLRSRVSSIIGSLVDTSAFIGLIATSYAFNALGSYRLFESMAIFYLIFFIATASFKNKNVYAKS